MWCSMKHRHIIAAGAFVFVAAPALALQTPAPSKGNDEHVCDVPYKPNDVVNVQAIAGNTVTVTLGAHERVIYVNVSDSTTLKYFVAENSNAVFLKASGAMPPQPISVRTLKEDGTPRDYPLQWSAVMPSDTAPKTCYFVRYQYPAEYSAEAVAKWRAQQAQAKADAAEIALHRASMDAARRNVKYVSMGDAQIGPTEIYDDGATTWLSFPGGMPIPSIYSVTPDGAEAVVGDVIAEDNGVIKVPRTMPIIRLRSGNLVLCMFNLAWNPIGTVPNTGTSDPNTRRIVGAYK
jgi:type IV secretion system protein VirB9